MEAQTPNSAFAGGVGGGDTNFPIAFDWNIEVVIEKFSVLLVCPFPGPLAGESKSLFSNISVFVLSVLISICRLPTFPFQS